MVNPAIQQATSIKIDNGPKTLRKPSRIRPRGSRRAIRAREPKTCDRKSASAETTGHAPRQDHRLEAVHSTSPNKTRLAMTQAMAIMVASVEKSRKTVPQLPKMRSGQAAEILAGFRPLAKEEGRE